MSEVAVARRKVIDILGLEETLIDLTTLSEAELAQTGSLKRIQYKRIKGHLTAWNDINEAYGVPSPRGCSLFAAASVSLLGKAATCPLMLSRAGCC